MIKLYLYFVEIYIDAIILLNYILYFSFRLKLKLIKYINDLVYTTKYII